MRLEAGIWKPEDVAANGDVYTPPKVHAYWNTNSIWDLKPTQKYDSDSNVWDDPANTAYNSYTPGEDSAIDLCTDYWVFGDTSAGCVQIEGTMTRYFTTADPDPTLPTDVKDIEWDYIAYQMHAQIQDTNPGASTNTALQWDE